MLLRWIKHLYLECCAAIQYDKARPHHGAYSQAARAFLPSSQESSHHITGSFDLLRDIYDALPDHQHDWRVFFNTSSFGKLCICHAQRKSISLSELFRRGITWDTHETNSLWKRINEKDIISTTLYESGSSIDYATRTAKILARRTKTPTYVGCSMNFAGTTVEEEMEGLSKVIDTVLTSWTRHKATWELAWISRTWS